jgi:hypothetical protein
MAIDQPKRETPVESQLPAKPKLPDVKYVAEQAYRDWFGKDVQETPTVSYVWTADQFGHFGLGFQITYALSWIAAILGFTGGWVVAGLAVANIAVWVVKEWFDYLREVRKSNEAKSVFRFNGREILWNVFTALFYISIGAIVAGAAAIDPRYGLISLLIITPFALGLAVWWLRRKITFQQVGGPYLYRLATFPNEIDRPTAEFLVEMSKPDKNGASSPHGMHIIVAGDLDSGKSSLAVGVGTEFAFRMGIGRYTTLVKLLDSARRFRGDGLPQREFDDGRILWPWQTADLLIIDDVELNLKLLGLATGTEASEVLAERLKATLQATIDPVLLQSMSRRRTVWVLGEIHGAELSHWRDVIASIINVQPAEIRTLDLRMKVAEALRMRTIPTKSQQVKQW